MDLAGLRLVSGGEDASAQPGPAPAPAHSPEDGADVFAAIERLADLRAKGILTEAEFNAKKADLLKRV